MKTKLTTLLLIAIASLTTNNLQAQTYTVGDPNTLFLRTASDINHGLAWYSNPVGGKPFGSEYPDGPVLFGYSGGILGVRQGSTNFAVLRWNSNGNVGIGGATPFTPSERLHVKDGNILLDYYTGTIGSVYIGGKPDASQNGMKLFFNNPANATYSGAYIDVRTGYTTTGLRFRVDNTTGSTERMRINADGNVGIGTSVLNTARLHVQAAATTNTTADNLACLSLDKPTSATTVRRMFMVPHLGTSAYSSMAQNGDVGFFWTDAAAGAQKNSTAAFVIAPWKDNWAGLRITADGNVGIGTPLVNNPYNYKLAVKGVIGAQELKIENTSTAWPDFVFAKNYSLMNLNELEAYLEVNKHLPNIPSAKEVSDNNGVLVGEFQTKLLQKIEELTLYVIQQNKEMEKIKSELNALKK